MSYFFISMLFSVFFTLLLLRCSTRLGLVDHPCARKCHDYSTPVIGGLAMFVAMVFSLFFLDHITDNFYKIIILSSFLVVLGALDDRFSIRASVRFLLQIILTVVLVEWTGYKLEDLGALFGQGSVVLGFLAIPMTVLGVVGTINAVNFSDGLDGLAGGYVMIAFAFLGIVAWQEGDFLLVNEFLLISGSVFAFLLFNGRYICVSKAKIFMGDAGSMFLGFLLVWYFISMSQGEGRLISPVTVLWLFAMPLFDTIGIMIRRVIHKRSPFRPDREHLHHILLHAGYGPCKTVNLMLMAALILGAIGLLGQITQVPESLMLGIIVALFALYFFSMMHAWKLMKLLRNVDSEQL